MTQSGMTFEERKDFIFVGNFLHEPNRDAVHYLKESVWPLIRAQLPDAGMCIYGAYPSQSVLQLHQPKERFFSLGRADDAQEVVAKARVMLAPLRFGAGMKGKLLEAMQCGTPSVTTAIGAESMYGDLPWNGFITRVMTFCFTPCRFTVIARACCRLFPATVTSRTALYT